MLKKTTVLKLSLFNTVEETRQAIAKAMKIPVDRIILSKEQIAQIEAQGKDRLPVRKMIAPFYDTIVHASGKENEKKRNELIDIGHFLYFLNNGTSLLECGERPDFVVEHIGERIGIEVTRLTDQELAAQVNGIRRIFLKATEILRLKSNTNGLYNISIDATKIRSGSRVVASFTKNERLKVAEEIALHVEKMIRGEESIRPNYIEDVIFVNHNELELVAMEPYFSQTYSQEKVLNTLRKKEEKLEAYRQHSGLNQFWLLIVINGISAESNVDITPEMLPNNFTTDFDGVYIFNFFKQTIIEMKVL